MSAHQVHGRLFRITNNGPTDMLLDVTGDAMTVYEQGRAAVRRQVPKRLLTWRVARA